MGYTGVVKIPSSPADFTLHRRAAALKTHENEKKLMDGEGISTTAVRLTLSTSREEE